MAYTTKTMSAHEPSCVLLADRHHRLSEGVRGLLDTTFSKVFMVADQSSLLEGARRLSPALVIVDVSFAQGDIADLLHSIRDSAPAAKVLLLSVHDEPAVAAAALAAGADGLVLTRAIANDLLPAVDALLAGRRYFTPVAGAEPAAVISRRT
jgi:DNA-binding NarL/FixJ family response regulator